MAKRYALRLEKPNSWTVFDIFTGQPVEAGHKIMVGIRTRRAEKMVAQLNAQDDRRRQETGRAI